MLEELDESLITIFCDVDEFCKGYESYCNEIYMIDSTTNGLTMPNTRMLLSGIMTIVIYFHLSGYRCFKWYYEKYIQRELKSYFPKLVSYNRL